MPRIRPRGGRWRVLLRWEGERNPGGGKRRWRGVIVSNTPVFSLVVPQIEAPPKPWNPQKYGEIPYDAIPFRPASHGRLASARSTTGSKPACGRGARLA